MLISCRRATEMFQFTRCPPSLPMCSAGGVQTSLWTGCPIRNLRAHRLHAAPPERFAGLRVLHRPSVPRHPPRTLCSLFLFVVYLLIPRPNDACGQELGKEVPLLLLLLYGKIEERKDSVGKVQLSVPQQLESGKQRELFLLKKQVCSTWEWIDHIGQSKLPRKEVIQPHLPVRLPCYDFTPITDPALDACLPQGVSPAASGVADFRGVTGGVYKTRERIHRNVLTSGY